MSEMIRRRVLSLGLEWKSAMVDIVDYLERSVGKEVVVNGKFHGARRRYIQGVFFVVRRIRMLSLEYYIEIGQKV